MLRPLSVLLVLLLLLAASLPACSSSCRYGPSERELLSTGLRNAGRARCNF